MRFLSAAARSKVAPKDGAKIERILAAGRSSRMGGRTNCWKPSAVSWSRRSAEAILASRLRR
ncbi:MAG: hypothetical protein H6882_07140 [Rhodobiaceae bacterium]|nr:hypothetical protein [Rhodobiaceae bacterium]